jgi:hypothetical protein
MNFTDDPLASFFSMRPLSKDSSSDGCFAIASQWLQNCLDAHDECPKQLSPLPSRVIDVGNNERDPFLHISQGECGPWLALSHCWGLEQSFTTTSSTLDFFTKGILMSDLPQTFKDAIWITRRLGYQYIWIDSLCIIQDSAEDWEAESKMPRPRYPQMLPMETIRGYSQVCIIEETNLNSLCCHAPAQNEV